ncbi:MAG: ISAs1 family transposase [Oscillospiraceae bacterium]|jgi:predicted transposase YbfD/YdcC|nr:ISAs1 family transposase [Oscillospiraceae bacterium]
MRYKNEDLNTIARHFECIEDPRDERGKLHRLIDIFVLTIYGSLWGHTDFTNMSAELKFHEAFFTELLGLPNGIPSHDTFSAVFSIISPQAFLECFISWLTGIFTLKGKHVAIDGKAVRAACEKIHGGKVPMLVNAYVVDMGLCIGQIRIDDKTNEIKGIPEMIEWLDLEGAVVSIDAIGCQKEIAEQLIEKGSDFILQVKENQPTLHEDILFEMQTRINEKAASGERNKKLKEKGFNNEVHKNEAIDVFETFECDHSRIERRTYYILNDNACIHPEEWPHIKSMGLVIRERLSIKRDGAGEIIDGEPSVEDALYVMSKTMKAEEFASYARGHWKIENSLHWVLDDFFREDRCTSRAGDATENLALMRKIVFNLTKMDENVKGKSMRWKQGYYRSHPGAVLELIFQEVPNKY